MTGSPNHRPWTSLRSTPYVRPHVRKYLARRVYSREPVRHYLGAMDRICGKCGAKRFKGEKATWCCDSGRTQIGVPETDIDIYEDDTEDDTDDVGGNEGAESHTNDFGENGENAVTESRTDRAVNANEKALNNILYSTNPTTGRLTEDCAEYREPQCSVQ